MSPGELTGLLLVHRDDDLARRSLESLRSVCGQVVVVKDSSKLCQDAFMPEDGITVTERSFDGSFPDQRNEGIKKALGSWVLSLDSDEVLSEELKVELRELTPPANVDVYRLTRLERIAGKLRNNTTVSTGKYHPRLFRSCIQYKPTPAVHERFMREEELVVQELEAPFIHMNNLTIRDRYRKALWYSEMQARTDDIADITRLRALIELPNLLLRRGYIKDGATGITEATIQTIYMLNRRNKQRYKIPPVCSLDSDFASLS